MPKKASRLECSGPVTSKPASAPRNACAAPFEPDHNGSMISYKEFFIAQVRSVGDDYLSDLEALSIEQLNRSPGGGARAPYDFTWEVITVNNRVAARLRGEDPGPWPFKDWATCPPELRDKAAIKQKFADAIDAVLDSLEPVSEEKFSARVHLPDGETSFAELANIVVIHTIYHDGQLNQVQAMGGDLERHW